MERITKKDRDQGKIKVNRRKNTNIRVKANQLKQKTKYLPKIRTINQSVK